jgi:hypothetical protein
MEILEFSKVDNTEFDISSEIEIYRAHVKVSNIQNQAKEMITAVNDTSWLKGLGVADRLSYEARAIRTIEKLVENIFSKVEDVVTEEFGEYVVSDTAGKILEEAHGHKRVPLAELFKEKLSGNPGFDFHTESHSGYIAFGEAKYSGQDGVSPHGNALSQIVGFIEAKKDLMELTDLGRFVSERALSNAAAGNKAYIAAFSINAQRPKTVINNAISSNHTKHLAEHRELYIIGVEIDD